MIANSTLYPLAPDLALQLPMDYAAQPTPSGVTAHAAGSGARFTLLLRPSAAGAQPASQLSDRAAAMLRERYSGLEQAGALEQVEGKGWEGQLQGFKAESASGQSLRLFLTTATSQDPDDAGRQRNLILLLEVPGAEFNRRPVAYRRFAQDRLLVGDRARIALAEQAAAERTGEALARPEAAVTSGQAQDSGQAVASVAPRRPARGAIPPMSEESALLLAGRGQRRLVFAFLLAIVVNGLQNLAALPEFLRYALPAAVLLYAASGVLQICSACGYSQRAKLAWLFGTCVPLLGLACWVYLSIRSTRLLRSAGYEVGLMGVRG